MGTKEQVSLGGLHGESMGTQARLLLHLKLTHCINKINRVPKLMGKYLTVWGEKWFGE